MVDYRTALNTDRVTIASDVPRRVDGSYRTYFTEQEISQLVEIYGLNRDTLPDIDSPLGSSGAMRRFLEERNIHRAYNYDSPAELQNKYEQDATQYYRNPERVFLSDTPLDLNSPPDFSALHPMEREAAQQAWRAMISDIQTSLIQTGTLLASQVALGDNGTPTGEWNLASENALEEWYERQPETSWRPAPTPGTQDNYPPLITREVFQNVTNVQAAYTTDSISRIQALNERLRELGVEREDVMNGIQTVSFENIDTDAQLFSQWGSRLNNFNTNRELRNNRERLGEIPDELASIQAELTSLRDVNLHGDRPTVGNLFDPSYNRLPNGAEQDLIQQNLRMLGYYQEPLTEALQAFQRDEPHLQDRGVATSSILTLRRLEDRTQELWASTLADPNVRPEIRNGVDMPTDMAIVTRLFATRYELTEQEGLPTEWDITSARRDTDRQVDAYMQLPASERRRLYGISTDDRSRVERFFLRRGHEDGADSHNNGKLDFMAARGVQLSNDQARALDRQAEAFGGDTLDERTQGGQRPVDVNLVALRTEVSNMLNDLTETLRPEDLAGFHAAIAAENTRNIYDAVALQLNRRSPEGAQDALTAFFTERLPGLPEQVNFQNFQHTYPDIANALGEQVFERAARNAERINFHDASNLDRFLRETHMPFDIVAGAIPLDENGQPIRISEDGRLQIASDEIWQALQGEEVIGMKRNSRNRGHASASANREINLLPIFSNDEFVRRYPGVIPEVATPLLEEMERAEALQEEVPEEEKALTSMYYENAEFIDDGFSPPQGNQLASTNNHER